MWISKQTLQSQKMLKITWNVKNCFGISNDFNAVIIMADIVDIIEPLTLLKQSVTRLGLNCSIIKNVNGDLCKKMDMRSKRC